MNKELIYQHKKIAYRVTGNGKPVLLIHGFGEEANIWDAQVKFLEDKFRLIIPDLPGSGQSEMIEDMSMEGMAEVMKAIVEREASLPSAGGFLESANSDVTSSLSASKVPLAGGFRGALIGHSMGGYIVLALVEKYPELVSAFGLFHSSAFADSEEKKATRRKGIEFINQHGAFEFLKTATPNLFSPLTKEKRPELIDQQVARLHNFSPQSLVSYYDAMMQRPDRTAVLRQAIVPVLFIMGKYDVAVPIEDGLKQCHLPEKSYIHVLHQSGHMGMLEEPDKCNHILQIFLQD